MIAQQVFRELIEINFCGFTWAAVTGRPFARGRSANWAIVPWRVRMPCRASGPANNVCVPWRVPCGAEGRRSTRSRPSREIIQRLSESTMRS